MSLNIMSPNGARIFRFRLAPLRAAGLLSALLLTLLTGCRTGHSVRHASPAAVSTSAPDTDADAPLWHESSSSSRTALMLEARRWLGTPYLYGGAENGVGADCSGMVMMAFLDALHLKIPRTCLKQSEFCHAVRPDDVRGGDLVFFATGKNPDRPTHVGIMLADGVSFIHASSTKGVCVSSMRNPYYIKRLIKYGRIPNTDNPPASSL